MVLNSRDLFGFTTIPYAPCPVGSARRGLPGDACPARAARDGLAFSRLNVQIHDHPKRQTPGGVCPARAARDGLYI
jgi:carboxylesterase type B